MIQDYYLFIVTHSILIIKTKEFYEVYGYLLRFFLIFYRSLFSKSLSKVIQILKNIDTGIEPSNFVDAVKKMELSHILE